MTRQNISSASWPSTADVVLDDADGHGDAVAWDLRQVRVVGQDHRVLFSAMSLFSRASAVRPPGQGLQPGDAVPEPVQQPDLVFREHMRVILHRRVEEPLLGGGLVRPGRPPRHREQGPREDSYSAGTAARTARPRNRRRCRRTRIRPGLPACPGPAAATRRPSSLPAAPAFPMVRDSPCLPRARRRPRPAPWPAVPPAAPGPGPCASPGRPAPTRDATASTTGSRARSPASAMITSLICASGISVQSTSDPDHERRRQQPPVLSLDVLLVQGRALRDAVDHSRPGLRVQPVLQRAERRVVIRAALRPDLPVPRHDRLRDRDHLQNTSRPPVRIFSVPPMTSADRSASPRSRPFFSGDASSPAGTATIIPAETGTAASGTG